MRAPTLLILPVLLASLAAGAAELRTPFKPWTEVQPAPREEFNIPKPERVTLSNGMTVFLLENHELPLVELALTIRTGTVYEPDEKAGLGPLTAEVMRSGGSAKFPADKLDETLEGLGASFWIGVDLDSGNAGFSCLREDFPKLLDVLTDVLRNPVLPEEKIELALSQARTRIARRNDNAMGMANREFQKIVYGTKGKAVHPIARVPEYETLASIKRADLAEFQQTYFQPGRFILSLTGAFKKEEALGALEKAFGAWPAQAAKPLKLTDPAPLNGQVFAIDRPQLKQTTILLGQVFDMRRDDPDYPAAQLLNAAVSGSMSSRLFTEIRTKKGLAYSVWGYARVPYDRVGIFSGGCLTRNEQALDALAALRAEFLKVRDTGITSRELEDARTSLLNSYVFSYDTPEKIVGLVRTYEYYGYPLDFDRKQYDALTKATLDDVNRVARKFLKPDEMLTLLTGHSADYGKPLESLGKVETVDVTIPTPKQVPLVIDPARVEPAKRLLEAALTAAGGVKAFQDVKSVRADLNLYMGSSPMRAVLRANLPSQVRADVAGPLGPITQIMAPNNAWQASGPWVKELKVDEARKNLRALLQTDLGILQWLASGQEGYNLQALDPVKDGERELLGVLIESERLGRFRVYFDSQTKLLAKIVYVPDGQSQDAEKLFSEHRKFGALTLAKRCEDRDPKARVKSVELTAIELNPALDASLFEKPERATAPPKPLE